MEINGWQDICCTMEPDRAILFSSLKEATEVADAYEEAQRCRACEIKLVEWRMREYYRISVYDIRTDDFEGYLGGGR